MEANIFWLKLWKLVAITFCVSTIFFTSCAEYELYLIKSAAEKGVDPIALRCAFGSRTNDICAMYFASKK